MGPGASTSAARTPSRSPGWPICTRWPASGRELTEVLEKQVAATADAEAQIPIYKRLGRIWGEKLSRERNALESWQKVLEIDPQDVEALRAIAANYRSAGRLGGAVADAAPAHRGRPAGRQRHRERRAEGAVTRSSVSSRATTLMRTAGRHRRLARGPASSTPRTSARWRRSRRLFTQEARWEEASTSSSGACEALANPTEQVDVLMQAASLWADKIGDGGSAARGLRARAADRSGAPDRLARARAALPPAQELGEAGRAPAGAHRVRRRRAGAHPAADAGRGDLRAAARRSRQRLRDAAGGVPRGLLERSRRRGAASAWPPRPTSGTS